MSPGTYLEKEGTIKSEEDFHYQFAAQMGSLSRKIYKEHGINLSDMELLKTIYLVYLEKETVVSKISEEQRGLLDKIGVNLEMC